MKNIAKQCPELLNVVSHVSEPLYEERWVVVTQRTDVLSYELNNQRLQGEKNCRGLLTNKSALTEEMQNGVMLDSGSLITNVDSQCGHPVGKSGLCIAFQPEEVRNIVGYPMLDPSVFEKCCTEPVLCSAKTAISNPEERCC